MPERTIVEVFGAGTTQTATELRIDKTGLAAVLSAAGYQFTPTATNSLDELVAAIVCAGLAQLSADARAIDPTARNVEFNYDPSLGFDSPTIDNQTYNRHTVEAVFYKPITTPKLNPSDLV